MPSPAERDRAACCIGAALSYERDAREKPEHPEAGFWTEMARTCREAAEGLMGWPKGTAQLPKPRHRARRARQGASLTP
jgi:hypothetical protein